MRAFKEGLKIATSSGIGEWKIPSDSPKSGGISVEQKEFEDRSLAELSAGTRVDAGGFARPEP